MRLSPETYAAVVKHHRDTREAPIRHEVDDEPLRPENIGKNETDYTSGSEQDCRGSGTGSLKEHKTPETR